jgi:predicted TIM-barrel fold metal-dependent hydrolase
VPWALPSLCIPQARRHPQLSIVLAHAGYGVYTPEAYVAATECQNIFLEPSWCTVHDLHWLVREIGAGRVLFGSDLPDNVPVELAKYHAAHLSEAELAACLGGTAERLFRLG